MQHMLGIILICSITALRRISQKNWLQKQKDWGHWVLTQKKQRSKTLTKFKLFWTMVTCLVIGKTGVWPASEQQQKRKGSGRTCSDLLFSEEDKPEQTHLDLLISHVSKYSILYLIDLYIQNLLNIYGKYRWLQKY